MYSDNRLTTIQAGGFEPRKQCVCYTTNCVTPVTLGNL